MGAIKILVVDKRAIVSTGISLILERYADFEVMGQAKSGEEVFQILDHTPPDVVCMDIDLPGPVGGLELIRRLHISYPFTRVVILTNLLEPTILRAALKVGVLSFLLKDATADELASAIRAASRGIPTLCSEVVKVLVREVSGPNMPFLTQREHQVLDLVARGLNNQVIGDELHISLFDGSIPREPYFAEAGGA